MRNLLIISFLFFLTIPVSAKEKAMKISYEVAHREEKLFISLSFKGDRSGATMISLPDRFAGQNELYKCVRNLKVQNPGAKLSDTDKPEIKKIEHSPNEEVKLSYELIQDWHGEPSAGNGSRNPGGGYRPVIKKDYFHVLGSGMWVTPAVAQESKIDVSINWKELPAGAKLANSYGANQPTQKFTTTPGALKSTVFVGGDFRVYERQVKGKPVFAAIRGKWGFSDEEFAAQLQKVIESVRGFWSDYNYPHYVVTAIPLGGPEGAYSFGGTGLTNSFATFMTGNVTMDALSALLLHEYFHNWNTIQFGGIKEPQALVYWFSEGFTDYYTYKLLHRAGLIDADRYIAQYNEFLKDYYLSEVRNVNNDRIKEDFFKDYNVGRLPYRRGFLIATKWDKVIREQSKGKKSLDDVMRNILKDARRGKIKELSNEYLLNLFSKYARYDFAADFQKYIERGETIGGFDRVFGSCAETYEIKAGRYQLGFDEAALSQRKMAGVVPGSAAYEAGLRDGQKLLALSYNPGNPAKEVEITVEVDGKRKPLKFLPQSMDKVSVPQFRFKDGAADKKQCMDAGLR